MNGRSDKRDHSEATATTIYIKALHVEWKQQLPHSRGRSKCR